MNPEWYNALLGGALIGLAVSIMLLFNGRVTGISGIIQSAIFPSSESSKWRWAFLIGLGVGGLILKTLNPQLLSNNLDTSNSEIIIAGLLVGFGTLLGSGCTSGHGVCGLSRMSIRSILATVTFISFGILTVFIVRNFL